MKDHLHGVLSRMPQLENVAAAAAAEEEVKKRLGKKRVKESERKKWFFLLEEEEEEEEELGFEEEEEDCLLELGIEIDILPQIPKISSRVCNCISKTNYKNLFSWVLLCFSLSHLSLSLHTHF